MPGLFALLLLQGGGSNIIKADFVQLVLLANGKKFKGRGITLESNEREWLFGEPDLLARLRKGEAVCRHVQSDLQAKGTL